MTVAREHRDGFTLLEVVIALGLTVLLLSAVYGALDLYWQYETAGRGEIAGVQLYRAVTRRVGADIGSIVMHVPQTETATASGQQAAAQGSSSTSSGAGTSSTSGTSGTASGAGSAGPSSGAGTSGTSGTAGTSGSASTSGTSPSSGTAASGSTASGTAQNAVSSSLNFGGIADSGTPPTFGLVGTAELMHLSISLPARDLAYTGFSSDAAASGRTSDLVVVTYGLAPIDSATLRALQQHQTATRPAAGFGRRVRDLYARDAAEETLDSPDLLAPEITEVQFRYFDGSNWMETWDSLAVGSLPRAIEVTLGFWNPPAPHRRPGRKRLEGGTVTSVSHVFHVPVSEPAVEAGSF